MEEDPEKYEELLQVFDSTLKGAAKGGKGQTCNLVRRKKKEYQEIVGPQKSRSAPHFKGKQTKVLRAEAVCPGHMLGQTSEPRVF